jgi:superfamily II DNA/RNA helicase
MTKFSDLNLSPKVLKAVLEAGYESPTPIQAGAIPPALEGRDVLGIAQTGTGKTASFTLPLITMLARGRARARMPRSLVLCPTRELAAQVAENFDTYAKHVKLTKALLIGGVSFKEQDTLIDKGVDVLIATPGRLLDHFERGKLILNDVKVMVVDEADRMLDMGFIPDIERIFGLTPFTRQTLFFSATMAPEIERITNTFLSNPARIEVARQASASETIEQGVVMFKGSRKDREATEKRNVLRKMIDAEGDKCTNAIIFCNRKVDVDAVAKSLKKHGYDAAPIHGDLDQSQRTKTLNQFRNGELRFLCASDVAARGLDVPSVSHVFNFDVPSHAEDYVHRIGRTGRAGREGKAMMICVPRDEKNFEDIERLLQKPIPRLENPLANDAPAPKEAKRDAAPKETKVDSAKKPKEDKPKRTRNRTRKTDVAQETTPAPLSEVVADVATTSAAEASEVSNDVVTKVQETVASVTEAVSSEPTPVAPDAKPNRTPGGRGRNNDRNKNDRGNDGNNDRGAKVAGLGEHTPTFIEKSFAERYDS